MGRASSIGRANPFGVVSVANNHIGDAGTLRAGCGGGGGTNNAAVATLLANNHDKATLRLGGNNRGTLRANGSSGSNGDGGLSSTLRPMQDSTLRPASVGATGTLMSLSCDNNTTLERQLEDGFGEAFDFIDKANLAEEIFEELNLGQKEVLKPMNNTHQKQQTLQQQQQQPLQQHHQTLQQQLPWQQYTPSDISYATTARRNRKKRERRLSSSSFSGSYDVTSSFSGSRNSLNEANGER